MKKLHSWLACGCLLLTLLVPPQGTFAEDSDEEEREEAAERRIDLLHSIAEAHFEKALLLQEGEQMEEAIEELEKILELPFPEGEDTEQQLFEVQVAIAEVYLEAERFREAEKILRETLEEFDDQPRRLADLHILMGRALSEMGRREEAIEHLSRAVELGREALDELDEDDL